MAILINLFSPKGFIFFNVNVFELLFYSVLRFKFVEQYFGSGLCVSD